MSFGSWTANPEEFSELVSSDFDRVYEASSCSPRDSRLVNAIQAPLYVENPLLSTCVMLPSGVPGRIGLDIDTAGNGRTPSTGALRLREIRKRDPLEPRYPTVTDASRPIWRCTFTFHDCSAALRKLGSMVAGARPLGRVVSS